MLDNVKEKIIQLLMGRIIHSKYQIKRIKRVNYGLTNTIFKVSLRNGSEYKIRFAIENPFINRQLEKDIDMSFHHDDIFFFDKNGDFIRKWIPGKCISSKLYDDSFWNFVEDSIRKIQTLNINRSINIAKPTYFKDDIFNNNLLCKKYECYKEIINSFTNHDFVLCHNDFSGANIIKNHNSYYLFDFEWASFNHKYWDVSNLIKDLEFTYEDIFKVNYLKKLNIKELVNIIYCVHIYSYIWTFNINSTKKILKYRKYILKRIDYWYHVLVNTNKVS